MYLYRDGKKGMWILLSNSCPVLPAVVKQQQEEISRNHVPSFFAVSVLGSLKAISGLKVGKLQVSKNTQAWELRVFKARSVMPWRHTCGDWRAMMWDSRRASVRCQISHSQATPEANKDILITHRKITSSLPALQHGLTSWWTPQHIF